MPGLCPVRDATVGNTPFHRHICARPSGDVQTMCFGAILWRLTGSGHLDGATFIMESFNSTTQKYLIYAAEPFQLTYTLPLSDRIFQGPFMVPLGGLRNALPDA